MIVRVCCVPDLRDGSCVANRVVGGCRVPALFEEDAVRHGGASVDTEVAVHEQYRAWSVERFVGEGESVVEPFVWLLRAVIMGTEPAVDNVRSVGRDELFIGVFGSGVEDVGDPGVLPLCEFGLCHVRIAGEVTADDELVGNWASRRCQISISEKFVAIGASFVQM